MPLTPPSSALRAPSPSREKVLLSFWKQWILQLRVNPSFQKVPFLRVYGGIVLKDPCASAREVSVQLKEPFMGEGGILAVGHGEDTIKGIFPKRPEKM